MLSVGREVSPFTSTHFEPILKTTAQYADAVFKFNPYDVEVEVDKSISISIRV